MHRKNCHPGLIHATTELGLIEMSRWVDQRRHRQRRNNVAASFRVWEGLNPASAIFAPTRNEGVTSAAILPQGGLISGQAAVINLGPSSGLDMIFRAPVAMIAQLDNPTGAGTTASGELIGKLRALLDDVKFYIQRRADYERAATRTLGARRRS
jgi:hypothetical protein